MTTTPKTIVVSACDDYYAPLANDLFNSIRALRFKAPFDLGLLDVGLGVQALAHFKNLGVKIEKAGVDIDYPAREQWEKKRPGLRTLTAELFLRRYFPDYDVYIWLDADVWVQTPEAIDTLIASAASNPAVHIACELDRCYSAFFEGPEMWLKFSGWYGANFPPETAAAMTLRPMLNVGVLAMRADSPVWDAWTEGYSETLQKLGDLDDTNFMAHQLGLNVLLYLKGLPCVILPASYNWLTAHALPKLDPATGMYVEPLPPYKPISQIHLTRPNKSQVEKIHCLDGTFVERKLTYSGRNA